METKNLLNKKITQWLLLVAMLVGCSTNALAAWLGNSGVAINDTWYKSSSNVDTSHWLNAKSKLSGANLGTFSSSFTIGAQFDTYDSGNTDYCSWNNKTGVYYKITTTSGTQIVGETRLYTCHAEKSGNNNVWKTNGGNSCGDSGSYGTKTIDVSSYTEGDYYLYVYYFSPSSDKYPSSGFTTTERATFKVKKPTKYTYTVYFKRPSDWSNTPHIHTWCDDGDIKSDTEMKSLPNQTGWYYYDVEYSTLQTQFKIKFNNGGWSGGQSGEATASFGSDKYCYSGKTPSTETCPSLCTPPTIITHPSDDGETLCPGVAATALSVEASGTVDSYQWYSYTNAACTTGKTKITSATSSSYTPSTATVGTLYYKCEVTGCNTTVTSDASGAITVKGVTIGQTGDLYEYNPITFTASSSATWSLTTESETAYISATSGTSTVLKAEAGTYTVTGAKDGCNTQKPVTISEWPNNCPQ